MCRPPVAGRSPQSFNHLLSHLSSPRALFVVFAFVSIACFFLFITPILCDHVFVFFLLDYTTTPRQLLGGEKTLLTTAAAAACATRAKPIMYRFMALFFSLSRDGPIYHMLFCAIVLCLCCVVEASTFHFPSEETAIDRATIRRISIRSRTTLPRLYVAQQLPMWLMLAGPYNAAVSVPEPSSQQYQKTLADTVVDL